MRRIMLIGPGGAGKSTLAVRMSQRLNLPVDHLDSLYWKPGWVPTPDDEWRLIVSKLIKGESWIIDGNYGGTIDIRLSAADTVVFLDVPRLLCLVRALKRRITFRRRGRPDMGSGRPERLSWDYLKWIWTYPSTRRPKILAKLQQLASEKRVVILRSRSDVSSFLSSLNSGVI